MSGTLEPARIEAGPVVLDPLDPADAAELAPLLDDPGLHEFIGGEPLTESELGARYRRLVAGAPPDAGATWLNWTVRRREDGLAVGTAQATVVGDEAALAWVVAARWQWRGYAGAAASALATWVGERGLTAVANIREGHAASERVALRAGLRLTDETRAGERVWRAGG